METILNYFPQLSEDQTDKFALLGELYPEWNQKINVISRKDIDKLYTHHILHSLSITRYKQFENYHRVLDVGTGGGFPGIPLAIMFPETEFFLVDSIGKKIRVVNEIVKSLRLKNITARHMRAEKVKTKFDYVVSRAVTQMPVFINWVRDSIQSKENDKGIIALKGGDLEEEMSQVKRKYSIVSLNAYFEEPFFETKKIVHVFI